MIGLQVGGGSYSSLYSGRGLSGSSGYLGSSGSGSYYWGAHSAFMFSSVLIYLNCFSKHANLGLCRIFQLVKFFQFVGFILLLSLSLSKQSDYKNDGAFGHMDLSSWHRFDNTNGRRLRVVWSLKKMTYRVWKESLPPSLVQPCVCLRYVFVRLSWCFTWQGQ